MITVTEIIEFSNTDVVEVHCSDGTVRDYCHWTDDPDEKIEAAIQVLRDDATIHINCLPEDMVRLC